MKTKPSRARRLLLLAGGVFGLLIMAVLAVYAWAWTSTDESTIARAMIWRESDVGDQHRFPARPIPTGARMSSLDAGVQADLVVSAEGKGLDELLRETDTLAFLVVHEDRLVHERYFDGATRESLQIGAALGVAIATTVAVSRSDDYLAANQGANPLVALNEGFQSAFLGCVVLAGIGLALALLLLGRPRKAPQEQLEAVPTPIQND